ncbi:MAG: chloramphenicol acetyltransferase CAT [Oscillospiraceae bacterium]|nr:chloramphenicol acetyltransferase CAT [Oscillospiraceae bacterium]
MDDKIKFTPIDIQQWNRGQIFWYFSQMAPTGYSLTVDIDITHMHRMTKSHGISFYPAYLWLVTKVLNQQLEFKMAKKDGQIGYYNTLTPLYAVFHEDDKTFSLMWTVYNDDFRKFYADYSDNQKKYKDQHGILAQVGIVPPENAYTVSCLPWLSFKHFAVHTYENKDYYFPSVESGKFYQAGERMLMPLSLTCHHATTDGYHVKVFVKTLQEYADKFEDFI